MKRRPLLWLGVPLMICLAVVFSFPTCRYLLLGLLQNEAFYDGRPTGYWVSALKKRADFVFERPPRDVGWTLAQGGAAAVPVLLDMLHEEDDEVRFQALLSLSAMKPGEAAAAVPALTHTLMNEEKNAKLSLELAAGALLRADREAAIRTFIAMLQGTRGRMLAAILLGNLGPKAKAAIEPLRLALEDQDLHVRVAAAQALWQIERHVDTRSLLLLAEGEKWAFLVYGSRHDTPVTLWKELGPEALEAVPELIQVLHNPDGAIRLRAVIALGNLGYRNPEQRIVRALVARLKDEAIAVRSGAATALGIIGPAAAPAVPNLIEALEDKDASTRGDAASALGSIGPAAKAAIPTLIAALQDESLHVRTCAALGLGEIGPDAKAAVPALAKVVGEKTMREFALRALQKIDPDGTIKEKLP